MYKTLLEKVTQLFLILQIVADLKPLILKGRIFKKARRVLRQVRKFFLLKEISDFVEKNIPEKNQFETEDKVEQAQ
jgi:hypothetical protein